MLRCEVSGTEAGAISCSPSWSCLCGRNGCQWCKQNRTPGFSRVWSRVLAVLPNVPPGTPRPEYFPVEILRLRGNPSQNSWAALSSEGSRYRLHGHQGCPWLAAWVGEHGFLSSLPFIRQFFPLCAVVSFRGTASVAVLAEAFLNTPNLIFAATLQGPVVKSKPK